MAVSMRPVNLDTRPDILATHRGQGTDARALDVFEGHLRQSARNEDLRADKRREADTQLLRETAAATLAVFEAIDLEAEGERVEVQREIDVAHRDNAGDHTRTAAVVNLTRLRESENVGELRGICEAAARAGDRACQEAVAIVRPRLEKMSAAQLGLSRSHSGPTQMTSPAFQLLCALPRIVGDKSKQKLDAVEARRQERRRQVLSAAGSIDPALPQLIKTTALRATVQTGQVEGTSFQRK